MTFHRSGALCLAACALAVSGSVAGARAQTFDVLWDFGAGDDGALPVAAMTYKAGRLYGTTLGGGGGRNYGTIYGYDLKTSKEEVLYRFTDGMDGATPSSTLADCGGLFYGTTQAGATNGNGTVFAFDHKTKALSTIHAFTGGNDGGSPLAGVLCKDGILYGTAFEGATKGQGTVFSIDLATGVFTTLHVFTGGADGGSPESNLILHGGELIGTTEIGGTYGYGTVYAVDPTTGTETVLHSFNTSDGSFPVSAVISLGHVLYGTTQQGGSTGYGVLFSLDMHSGKEKTLHSFDDPTEGADPLAGLLNVNGTLYGTTTYDGPGGYGTVFSYDPATKKVSVVHAFADGADGGFPQAGLKLHANTIYGTSGYAGPNGGGAIFSIALP